MDEKTRRVAVLVSALDTESADLLLERMGPQRARYVRDAIMQLDDVSEQEEQRALADFFGSGNATTGGGVELDESLARQFAVEVSEDHDTSGIETDAEHFRFLRDASVEVLAAHLGAENPQVTAVVVAHLPPKRAAELITHFTPPRQADVMRRVAELSETDPVVVRELEELLMSVLAEDLRAARNRASGMAAVKSILDAAGDDRSTLWENMQRHDRALGSWLNDSPPESSEAESANPAAQRTSGKALRTARLHPAEPDSSRQEVRTASRAGQNERPTPVPDAKTMLPFENITELTDAELSAVFRELPADVFLLALAGAPEPLVEQFLAPMSKAESRAVRRKMEQLGPLRLDDIDIAQRQVAAAASRVVAQRPAARHRSRFAAAA